MCYGSMNSSLTVMGRGYKEHSTTTLEDELHNVVHMGSGSAAPPSSQDISGSLPPRPIKAAPSYVVGVFGYPTPWIISGLSTPLDNEAAQRGTSVYLVERRINMLPKPLTEGFTYTIVYDFIMEKGAVCSDISESIYKVRSDLKYALKNYIMEYYLEIWADESRYPNLVSLTGHCILGGEQDDRIVKRVFLVYELLPNGNYSCYLTGHDGFARYSAHLANGDS